MHTIDPMALRGASACQDCHEGKQVPRVDGCHAGAPTGQGFVLRKLSLKLPNDVRRVRPALCRPVR
jgi:hypothetical protein